MKGEKLMGQYVNAVTEEIIEMLNSGIKVNYNGYEIKNESDISSEILHEDDCCMKDYIVNDEGECIQVNYDILTSF